MVSHVCATLNTRLSQHLASDLPHRYGLTGTSTAPAGSILYANLIGIDDGLNAGHPSTQVDAFYIQDAVNALAKGSRNAIDANVVVLQKPTDNLVGTSFPAYVGGVLRSYSNKNVGGTSQTFATVAGSLFGVNPTAHHASGGTNYYGIAGGEIDVIAETGSSLLQKFGLTVIQGSLDKVRGSKDDAALAVLNQPGASGWNCGLCVNTSVATWPIPPQGTIIGATRGASATAAALHGIDLSAVSFGGYAFRSNGFFVDCAGNTRTAELPITGHIVTNSAPALSAINLACGTGASVNGNDTAGTIKPGAAVTSCTITFNTAYSAVPRCVFTPVGSPLILYLTTQSPTAVTIASNAAFNGSSSVNYFCASAG